jgi:hypothetical protein
MLPSVKLYIYIWIILRSNAWFYNRWVSILRRAIWIPVKFQTDHVEVQYSNSSWNNWTRKRKLFKWCKIWDYYGGNYEEFRFLGYKTPIRNSQETHYMSATESSRLMLCNFTFSRQYLWRIPSSGMWSRVGLVGTEGTEDCVTSIIRVEIIVSYLACRFFHPDDGGDVLLKRRLSQEPHCTTFQKTSFFFLISLHFQPFCLNGWRGLSSCLHTS